MTDDIRSELSAHRATLTRDIETLLADLHALLREATTEAGAQAGHTRGQFRARLDALQLRLRELEAQARGQIQPGAQAGDAFVHEHPWRVLGAAAAFAAACGTLCALALDRRG
ncbi:YqjD family protein [Cupriavidus sp. WS]|uniref:DUF883 family protein n=1 Tax=Cupriavidus sp. WS TaxID=1312922 RepID=UPI00037714EF|nr:DUF883 family protein [Cupriavidus sp. WS]